MIRRCDTCEFWMLVNQWGKQEKRHQDDRVGSCRRNAPATIGEYEYYVRRRRQLHQRDRPDQFRQRLGGEQSSTWPCTHARDWCGEWKQQNAAQIP